MYDLIVVGKGPAGCACAIYALRGGLTVLVVGKDYGALEKAEKIENYYGVPSVSGKELADTGIKQVKDLGGTVTDAEVVSAEYSGAGFTITTQDNIYESKTIMLAPGKARKKPPIKNIDDFLGRGISFCASCDGFFYRGKTVGIYGSGEFAVHERKYLEKIAGKVIAFDAIEALVGDDKLKAIVSNGKLVPVDGLFIAMGSMDSADIANKLGLLTEKGNIKVNQNMQTNINGAFAGGDCTGGAMQIAKAVSDGSIAGMEIVKYIKKL